MPTTGEWFTITAVIDLETGFFTLYVDGVAIASATISVGTHLSINPNSWIVSKYQSHHYAVNEEGKYVDADGNVFEDQTKRYELTYEDNCYVDDVCTYVLNGTNGTEVTVDIDADKDLQYVGAKINGEDVVTLSPKFFKAADDATFAAAAVYFNAEGEYNGIVSKPTDGTTSVRYGEPTGLRFKTTINEALVAELQA
ncbi:MAG: hypothetical protein IJX13_06700, partial [Clostridia bacterium]|nr:hypothetical protein [Clostridia bacterium]